MVGKISDYPFVLEAYLENLSQVVLYHLYAPSLTQFQEKNAKRFIFILELYKKLGINE